MSWERYSRQIRFAPLGQAAQERFARSRVLIAGCGALGTVLADLATRAGIGYLRIVDRDFVDLSNLQRQVLFNEDDVRNHLPKSIAAANALRAINGDVTIEPIVADIDHQSLPEFAQSMDLILDASDNFELRFLINDVSLELNIPWIYAGALGSSGQTMTILPGLTPCLRCLMESPPDAGSTETCDAAGVIAPIIHVLASLQMSNAFKILAGLHDQIPPQLTFVDVWTQEFRTLNTADLRERADCPACDHGARDWLRGTRASPATVLCGRNSVQVTPAVKGAIDFRDYETRWEGAGVILKNPFLMRLQLSDPNVVISLFRDGRAIIQGTDDTAVARSLYSRYVGS